MAVAGRGADFYLRVALDTVVMMPDISKLYEEDVLKKGRYVCLSVEYRIQVELYRVSRLHGWMIDFQNK